LVDRGANAIARLKKRDVEALLIRYDQDPIAALTTALRIVLERPDGLWPDLIAAAPFSETRRAAVLLGEEGALDDLAAELNELRDLARP
jgi:hypothetical protein